MKAVRVLLADDQPLVRAGLRTLLELDRTITVVGEASDGAQAVSSAREHRPDVVLMDIRMPLMDGIEATRRIAADPDLTGTRVVALTTYELEEYVFAMLRAGACGFLTKDVRPDRLREAVHLVAVGESLLSPAATRAVIAEFVESPPTRRTDEARLAVFDASGTRGGPAGRRRADQRGDRRAVVHEPGNGTDARRPGGEQARCAGPGTSGGRRL